MWFPSCSFAAVCRRRGNFFLFLRQRENRPSFLFDTEFVLASCGGVVVERFCGLVLVPSRRDVVHCYTCENSETGDDAVLFGQL